MQGATTEDALGNMVGGVSIHAPYAGSDAQKYYQEHKDEMFQSTPPMQGATKVEKIWTNTRRFQSTPPMQGATMRLSSCLTCLSSFNPRPLCRERRIRRRGGFYHSKFQSTPPMQGATVMHGRGLQSVRVSIHAPYAGSDRFSTLIGFCAGCFNPRPLCRERR